MTFLMKCISELSNLVMSGVRTCCALLSHNKKQLNLSYCPDYKVFTYHALFKCAKEYCNCVAKKRESLRHVHHINIISC